ncbi:MAG: VOC family protein [Anaerolineae bacterium]|nr:VOC family protein [Anaerolineae bacterium]
MPLLKVQDVRSSVSFYVNQLGFEKDVMFNGPEGHPVFAIVRLGQSVFGLSAGNEETGAGTQFIVSIPENTCIDLLYSNVMQHGVLINQDIKDSSRGDRIFSILDPDGYLISIARAAQQISCEDFTNRL